MGLRTRILSVVLLQNGATADANGRVIYCFVSRAKQDMFLLSGVARKLLFTRGYLVFSAGQTIFARSQKIQELSLRSMTS